MASAAPIESKASFTIVISILLLLVASFPPFNKSPFAELKANDATLNR